MKISSTLEVNGKCQKRHILVRIGDPSICSQVFYHSMYSFNFFFERKGEKINISSTWKVNGKRQRRGHQVLNWGTLDVQSNALPLSCIPRNQLSIFHIVYFFYFFFFSELVKRRTISSTQKYNGKRQRRETLFRRGDPRSAVKCATTELHLKESSYPALCVFFNFFFFFWEIGEKRKKISSTLKVNGKRQRRGHPGLNRGPLDLQSNALPLSYIPNS